MHAMHYSLPLCFQQLRRFIRLTPQYKSGYISDMYFYNIVGMWRRKCDVFISFSMLCSYLSKFYTAYNFFTYIYISRICPKSGWICVCLYIWRFWIIIASVMQFSFYDSCVKLQNRRLTTKNLTTLSMEHTSNNY